MNPTVRSRCVSISAIIAAVTLAGLLAVSCTTGESTDGPAPTPVVIEREVVRTVVVEAEKTVVQEAPAPPPVVVERDVVRTVVVEVEKPVVQEVTKVVERDPEVMLVVRHGSPSEAREENFAGLFSNPAWAGLTAAQSGRTHELSEWLYLRYPGPRVVWAMQELRPLLYPETLTGSEG